MVKYKINFIYENNKNVNEVFIRVLNKELNKALNMTCKKQKDELTSSCSYLSLENKEGKIDVI